MAEQAQAKTGAENIVHSAKEAVEEAETQQAVGQAAGTAENQLLQMTLVGRDKSITAVDETLRRKYEEIDQNGSLSAEDQTRLKAEAKAFVDKAKEAIAKATSQAAVEAAKKEAEKAVTELKVEKPADQPKQPDQGEALRAAKAKAQQALTQAAEAKRQAIEKNDKLSPKEKQEAQEQVQQALEAGEVVIAQAEDEKALKGTETRAVQAITQIEPLGKDLPKRVLEQLAHDKLAEIEENKSLSEREKGLAKAKVNEAKAGALKAIDQAKDQVNLDAQTETAKKAFEAIRPLGLDLAEEAINKASRERLAQIEQDTSLSPAEKAEAKALVQGLHQEAVKAIQAAKDQASIDQVKTQTVKNIADSKVESLNETKVKAKQAIDQAAAEKQKALEGNEKLSAKEKADAVNYIKATAKAKKEEVEKAANKGQVANEKAAGLQAMAQFAPIGKDLPKQAVEQAVAAKLAEIEGNQKMSVREKDLAKQAVAKAKEKALETIKVAQTQVAMDDQLVFDLKDIQGVSLLGRDLVLADIDKKLEEKLAQIEQDKSLTAEERKEARAIVQGAAEEAKKAVLEAKEQGAIDEAHAKAVENIKKGRKSQHAQTPDLAPNKPGTKPTPQAPNPEKPAQPSDQGKPGQPGNQAKPQTPKPGTKPGQPNEQGKPGQSGDAKPQTPSQPEVKPAPEQPAPQTPSQPEVKPGQPEVKPTPQAPKQEKPAQPSDQGKPGQSGDAKPQTPKPGTKPTPQTPKPGQPSDQGKPGQSGDAKPQTPKQENPGKKDTGQLPNGEQKPEGKKTPKPEKPVQPSDQGKLGQSGNQAKPKPKHTDKETTASGEMAMANKTKHLPQTGEQTSTAVFLLGVASLALGGLAVKGKKEE